MLSNWTGLKLHPNFEGDESDDEEDSEEEKREPTGGAQRCSIRKWKNGNYTLLHDADSKERASVDLFIHLLPKKRKGKTIKIFMKNFSKIKLKCVSPMVDVSILPQAELGTNDHREDVSLFTFLKKYFRMGY